MRISLASDELVKEVSWVAGIVVLVLLVPTPQVWSRLPGTKARVDIKEAVGARYSAPIMSFYLPRTLK